MVSQCADRQPVPCLVITQDEFWVRAERERLQLAIYHAVRNAQDATPAEGSVTVTVRADATHCLIDISDTGTGMDEEFVRQRLFRPFDSTKGTQGMGIGAYQIRETVLALGGELSVESTVGKGTTVLVKLNLLRHLRNDHH